MACPFLDEPIDIEAQILRRNLSRERVIRPHLDVLLFPDDHLFERYRFSAQSIIYLNDILSPHIVHMTLRGHALSSGLILCVALRFFFSSRSFLYNIGDAENISKAAVCRAVRNVTLALKRSHLRHRPTRLIKEEFHRIAGFPGVIGCIDGTHIPITAPSVNEGDYVNRKSFHSIIVQLYYIKINILFLQLQLKILTVSSYYHRRVFQCLCRLRVTPERACDIIVACVILHNITTIRGEQCPTQPVNDPDNDPNHPADTRDGRAVRDTICYHNF
ncbi:HARB1 nuclease, partial [Amia calva]|nr:HARB1 nuclease [Amia calva]